MDLPKVKLLPPVLLHPAVVVPDVRLPRLTDLTFP